RGDNRVACGLATAKDLPQNVTVARVDISELTVEGDGLGRDQLGAWWRVPSALPGDVVEADGPEQSGLRRAARSTLVTPSPDRVASYCSVKRCGGCALRELEPSAASAAKRHMVEEALRRIGGIDLVPAPIVTGAPLGYR